MTRLLAVPRSDYCKWRHAKDAAPSQAQGRREQLDAKVKMFREGSDGVYGAPRIFADLCGGGEVVSRKTVAASMRRQGIADISPRTFTPVTTVVDQRVHRPKDQVDRRFDRGSSTGRGPWTSPICGHRTGVHRCRRHSAIGRISPVEFEEQFTRAAKAA